MKKTNSPKYDQIIEAALELFRKHGFKKVTVEEICKNAEVSKMTFYKFFKNKPDLVDKVWENQFELGMQQFEEIEKMDIPFTKKIQMFLKLKEENTKKFGPGFVEDYIEFMPEFLKTYSTQYNIAMQRFYEVLKTLHHNIILRCSVFRTSLKFIRKRAKSELTCVLNSF